MKYLFKYIFNIFKHMTRINIQLYNNSNPKMSNIFKNNSRFAGLIDKPEYDKSSTSVKLMKKMGWKEGDGLGKNQDGIKTPLQVEKHENNTGIGFEVDEKKINTFNTFKSDNNSFKNDGYRERRYNRYNDEYGKISTSTLYQWIRLETYVTIDKDIV